MVTGLGMGKVSLDLGSLWKSDVNGFSQDDAVNKQLYKQF